MSDNITLPREAGLTQKPFCRWCGYLDDLMRFAALVAAHEREACAKACEDEAAEFRSQKEGCRDARYDWKEDAAMECSLAIRKRGEVKP